VTAPENCIIYYGPQTRPATLNGARGTLQSTVALVHAQSVINPSATSFTNEGVTVTLTRPDTGYQQTVVTDSVGVARGVALPSGSYTVRIELAGFATVVEEHVVVRVGQQKKDAPLVGFDRVYDRIEGGGTPKRGA